MSLLVGLLVDKFAYHLPLYRQHQRLTAAGVTLSRATPTNLVKRAIMLLEPIVDTQRDSVLQSQVLAIDEAPGKVRKSDPYLYLIDVLQRISIHPNNLFEQLTPRLWKRHFVDDPMQSELMLHVYDRSE